MDLTRQGREDKAMRKTGVKKPKAKRGNESGDLSLEQELDHLADEMVEVVEEIELASREGSTLEDIEGAKAFAAETLDKYSAHLEHHSGRDRIQLEQSIGPMVERIKKGLTLLKEAPE
jgi:hypothetical protein